MTAAPRGVSGRRWGSSRRATFETASSRWQIRRPCWSSSSSIASRAMASYRGTASGISSSRRSSRNLAIRRTRSKRQARSSISAARSSRPPRRRCVSKRKFVRTIDHFIEKIFHQSAVFLHITDIHMLRNAVALRGNII